MEYYSTCLCNKRGGIGTSAEQVVEKCEKADRVQLYYTDYKSEDEPAATNPVYPTTHASVVWYKDTGSSVQDVIASMKSDLESFNLALQSKGLYCTRIADDCYTDSGVMALSARQGMILWKELMKMRDPGYSKISAIDKDGFLYRVEYQNYDFTEAFNYFNGENTYLPEGASALTVGKGSLFGKNFDSLYDNTVSFLVSTPATYNRNAVLGLATGIKGLSKDNVLTAYQEKTYLDGFTVLPYALQDGINEYGLAASLSFVSNDAVGACDGTVPRGTNVVTLYDAMLVRYVLDNFKTLDEAEDFMLNKARIFTSPNLTANGLEARLVLTAKGESPRIYEWTPDENGLWRVSLVEDYSITTGFYQGNLVLPSSGFVYTPVDINGTLGHSPKENGISALSHGLERYNLAKAKYEALGSTEEAVLAYLADLFQTTQYNEYQAPFWYSEYSGIKELTNEVATTKSTWGKVIQEWKMKFAYRTRVSGEENYGTKQSLYSVVYNLDNKTLTLVSQEKETEENNAKFTEVTLKTLEDIIGRLEDLNTIDKSTLVAAINELVARVTALENK